MPLKKIAVLVSGGGSNLQSLIDHVHGISGHIQLVISDKAGAYALTRAERAGIPTAIFDYKTYKDKALFFQDIFNRLEEEKVEGIVMGGFLKILPSYFAEKYPNKIINIHPSLIPAFCGKGYYGLKVHQAVIAYGVKVTGATVHFADHKADTGPIIIQRTVPVFPEDTAEVLQKRVLEIEHQILPEAVAMFCLDKLEVNGRIIKIKE